MTLEEALQVIRRVDRALRANESLADDETRVNLSPLYDRHGWGHGATPLPDSALEMLSLEDRTSDKRWASYFLSHKSHLGVYRSGGGTYWLLCFDDMLAQHRLERVGTAFDTNERFGDG